MPDHTGWPDPAHPGVPANPGQEGPHLIADEFGKRWWAWWMPDSSRHGGSWTYAAGGGAGVDWTYVGPAKSPDDLPV